MAKERVFLHRNTGTQESPTWEKWFAKTIADAVLMSDEDGESKNIKQYVEEQIALLIGEVPETGDTLKKLFDLITNHNSLVDALHTEIVNKANLNHSHEDATSLVSGFMSADEKRKLAGAATILLADVLPENAPMGTLCFLKGEES